MASKNKEIQDVMQYEIEFFKKEVARLGCGPDLVKANNFLGHDQMRSVDGGEKDSTSLKKLFGHSMITPIQHQKRGGVSSSDERSIDDDAAR